MKMYKLTDEDGQTFNETQWGEGITHTASGNGDLCTSGWIHVYDDPFLAVIFNPIHADFKNPRLWECECSGAMEEDHGLKFDFASCTTLKEIRLPKIGYVQKIAFGILCILEVYKSSDFEKWANNWLSGKDRTNEGARQIEMSTTARSVTLIARSATTTERQWSAWAVADAASYYLIGKQIDYKAIIRKAMEIK